LITGASPASLGWEAAAAVTEFGAVHVLCNNAGVGIGSDFVKIPLSTWEWGARR